MNIRAATADDWRAILGLLQRADLPSADLDESHTANFLVAVDRHALAGAVAVEPFGADGLLRSLVVDAPFRDAGIGQALTQAAEVGAKARGLNSLVLLTTTAAGFFERLDYARIDRTAAPPPIRTSAEFARLCPASAICMRKEFA